MKRFKNILAVYDYGPGSEEVLTQAVRLASANGAKLTVVKALDDLKYPMTVEAARQRLARIEPWLAQEGVSRVYSDILVGTAHVEIMRRVEEDRHDLVVVSAEGNGTIKDMVFGNTPTNVLLKCPCDVWLIKPRQPVPCTTVLAAVDLGRPEHRQLNSRIVTIAASLAQAQDATLHAIYFWDVDGRDAEMLKTEIRPETTREIVHVHESRHRKSLNTLLRAHAAPDRDVQTHLVRGKPTIQLAKEALALSADVIVMGTASRQGISRFVQGNFPETVLHQGRSSVVVVKPDRPGRPTIQRETAHRNDEPAERASVAMTG